MNRGIQNRRTNSSIEKYPFHRSLIIPAVVLVVFVISILKRTFDPLSHDDTLVVAFHVPDHRPMQKLRPLSKIVSNIQTLPTIHHKVGMRWTQGMSSTTQSSPKRFTMRLYLMNWLGFGSNSDDGSGGGSVSNSPQDASTILMSSTKDNGKSSNSGGSKAAGSTMTTGSGVVTIMDSMDQLKRSQRIGKITASLVQELKSIMVEGSSENGKIKIILDGQQNPISTYIDENYYREQLLQRNNNNNSDSSELTNALTSAMKDARMKSIEKMNEKMKNVYNELGFYNNASQ